MEQFLLNLLKTSLLGVERGDKAAKRPAVEPLQDAAALKFEVSVL